MCYMPISTQLFSEKATGTKRDKKRQVQNHNIDSFQSAVFYFKWQTKGMEFLMAGLLVLYLRTLNDESYSQILFRITWPKIPAPFNWSYYSSLNVVKSPGFEVWTTQSQPLKFITTH